MKVLIVYDSVYGNTEKIANLRFFKMKTKNIYNMQ
jgi:flavodoxin